MEIPAALFFFVWALIGVVSLYLGFYILDTTDLSSSVPLQVVSFFEGFLTFFLFSSILFAPMLHKCSYIWTEPVMCSPILPDATWMASCTLRVRVFFKKTAKLLNQYYFFPTTNMSIFGCPLPVVFIGVAPIIFSHYVIIEEYYMNPPRITRLRMASTLLCTWLLPFLLYILLSKRGARIAYMVDAVVAKLKETKLDNFVAFAVGILGELLFQSFFKLTSFSQVVAFFYLAVAWLATLVLLGISQDFGVLNFLLGNVVVGCAVGQHHLQIRTWLAYAASVLLYGLHLKLESLTIVHRPNQHPQVILW